MAVFLSHLLPCRLLTIIPVNSFPNDGLMPCLCCERTTPFSIPVSLLVITPAKRSQTLFIVKLSRFVSNFIPIDFQS